MPAADTVIAGKLYLVDRQGQTQANIAVGEVGIDLLDPDNFALDVLGDIMNGFGGRLFDELRSREVPQCCKQPFCDNEMHVWHLLLYTRCCQHSFVFISHACP